MDRFREPVDSGKPPWVIIFTDLMTLLLTFFIILVSMSVIDEQSRVRAVESVRSVFGVVGSRFNFNEPDNASGLSSGALSDRPEDSPNEARQLLFADNQHITLRHSESFLILEVSSDMLFEPGGASISASGRVALDRLAPALLNMQYPAVIAGHGAPGYSEGAQTSLSEARLLDGSWALSMERGLAVYRHFTRRGVDENLLLLESFGSHRPEYDNSTAGGRRRNRRVDIILDRRNAGLSGLVRQSGVKDDDGYFFRDFRFDLDLVPPDGSGGEGAR